MIDLVVWLRNLFHKVPHLDFSFRVVDNVFVIDLNDVYSSSLALLAIFALVPWSSFPSMLSYHLDWLVVRNLTVTLFVLNVICFILLAACLYGNDYLNRSMITKVSPQLKELNNNLQTANNRLTELTQNNISVDISQLKTLVDEKARQTTANQTLITQVNRELDKIISQWKELRQNVEISQKSLHGLNKLENAYKSTNRWEFERWILVVTLLSIMFAVLFVGVLAICKKSRGAIVAFSGLGIVVFVLAWTIFSVLFPVSVAFADFCETSKVFISHHLPDGIYSTLNYYEKCVPGKHSDTFGELQLNKLEELLVSMEAEDNALRASTKALFGENTSVKNLVNDISSTTFDGFKKLGTISTLASCTMNNPRVHEIIDGFCYYGFLGNFIFLASIFLFGIFMAFLLMVGSRGWFAFERLPNDYLEVGDDDPFYPRQNDAIPADIYGTHLLRPGLRSTENQTESTSTSGNHNMIGSEQQRTPLLINGDHHSWQQPPNEHNRYI
ncbi:Protein tweety-like protein [Aphelenchoides bicaudatus]|nr:Protein tweety-like protein [Aphelenchoides bicaudatus]